MAALLCAPLLFAPLLLVSAPYKFETVAFAQSVTESFNKARRLFDRGKLRASYKILSGLVKRYPDHQPSRILLGRILFRSGKIGAAAKHFRKISPDSIAPDFAYEYGIVMFSDKQCDRAQAGFARVPSSSKLAPLANFYRGVCYVRSQEWEKADKYMQRAKGLPANLEQTRRQALTQIRRELRAERSGVVGPNNNPYLIVPTPPPFYAPPAPLPGAPVPADGAAQPPPDTKPPEPPPPPPIGWNASYTPSFNYTSTHRADDYHNTGLKNTDTNRSEIKLAIKSVYSFAARSFGSQPTFSLPVDFAQINTAAHGATVKYTAYEDDPGSLTEEQTGVTDTVSKSLDTLIAPELAYPVTSAIDMTVSYAMKDSYAGMKPNKKSSTAGPVGSVSFSGESFTLRGSGSSTDTVNVDGKTTKTTVVMGVSANKDFENASISAGYTQTEATSTIPIVAGAVTENIGTNTVITASGTRKWEGFSLTATVTDSSFAPASPLLVRLYENARMTMELSANKSFDFGGSFTLTMQQNTIGSYKLMFADKAAPADADPKPQVVINASGTEQVFLGVLKLTPLSWLSGSLTVRQAQTTYTQSNADYQKEFMEAVPDIVTEYIFGFTVTKTF